MRIYDGQVPTIARDVARVVIDQEVLEVLPEHISEFELDIEAVLREYIRVEREVTEEAKDLSERRGLGYGSIGRLKRQVAKEKGFKLGEDAVAYIIQQLIETFFHTMFVEEVFGEDHDIRRTIAPVLKKAFNIEQELDGKVRSKIKNLEEGSKTWEIEYQRAMNKIKSSHNLE